MNKLAAIINTHGDHADNIDRIVRLLGRDKLRLRIFSLIHGRGSRPRSITQMMDELGLKANNRQVVLNQANYLAKHTIISRSQIGAKGRQGTEAGYSKNDYCMANKAEILRKVRNPSLLEKTPTKRRPQIDLKVRRSISGSPRRATGKRIRKLKVLYLTASPASQPHIRTDAEIRRVQAEIRGSVHRDRVAILSSPAADAKSILDGINDHKPQIVHFSGHGGDSSIWLDDGKVHKSVGRSMSFDLLTETLSATDFPPKVLVLNACNTLSGAKKLLKAADVVIAMSDSISDVGATIFAAQFYAAIASGQSISMALKQGTVAMKHALLNDAHLPRIINREGVDPTKMVLVRS
jgi:hypothetical protein